MNARIIQRHGPSGLLLAGIVLSAFNLRTAVTSLTPLLDSLAGSFGFGSAMIGVFGMVPTAAFAACGLLTPAVIRRLDLEATALLAMVLAAAGLLLRALALDTWGLLAASVLALAGMGMGNVVLPPLVQRHFPGRIGMVSTIYITVLQVGTVVPALVTVPLAQALGWRAALALWALVALAAAVVWLRVIRALPVAAGSRADVRRAKTLGRRRPRAAPESLAPVEQVRSGAVVPMAPKVATAALPALSRSPLAWGLTAMFGMTSLISFAMFTWLPMIMTSAGASPAFGGAMLALFAALGLASALTMPALAVRLRNPFPVVLVAALAYAVAFPGLLLAPMAAPVLWVVLLGIGPVTFPLSLTLINLRTRSAEGSARLSGFMHGIGYGVSCLGPLLFGLLHGATGSWGWPFAFLGLCVLVLLAGAWQGCKPRKLEDGGL
ncbi:MAG: MFS transporter [Xanthomonadales bacterium]|nr:MFS transporter [Xanthomonadales bacterium]